VVRRSSLSSFRWRSARLSIVATPKGIEKLAEEGIETTYQSIVHSDGSDRSLSLTPELREPSGQPLPQVTWELRNISVDRLAHIVRNVPRRFWASTERCRDCVFNHIDDPRWRCKSLKNQCGSLSYCDQESNDFLLSFPCGTWFPNGFYQPEIQRDLDRRRHVYFWFVEPVCEPQW
jgi:hypothetical protein